ncbi:RdRP-domain-containing protein [Gonapodya prolifera JEL478]|uniref:RNA-dependent RNA polymerase n=1 Tax=Gonapodya prolifera (strain JEL478) TaxID=1344416 RepID=A0A139AZT6_GONPJ|nr:RdRP-domain-containing protein [Gonapodya prolifera JEL478]|eukprot:KXS22224.1 RdRP-domain-containing protein [Gonapodya prolifera JEL478]
MLQSNVHAAHVATKKGEVRFHVKRIPFSADANALKAVFEQYGTVVNVQIPEERDDSRKIQGRRNRGFAFVTFLGNPRFPHHVYPVARRYDTGPDPSFPPIISGFTLVVSLTRENATLDPKDEPHTFKCTALYLGHFILGSSGAGVFHTDWESSSRVVSKIQMSIIFAERISRVSFSCHVVDFKFDVRFKDSKFVIERLGNGNWAITVTMQRPPRLFVREEDSVSNSWSLEDTWKRISSVYGYFSKPAQSNAAVVTARMKFLALSSPVQQTPQRLATTDPPSSFPSFGTCLSFRAQVQALEGVMTEFQDRARNFLLLDVFHPRPSVKVKPADPCLTITDEGLDFMVFYHLFVLISQSIISCASPSLVTIVSLVRETSTQIALEALRSLYDPTKRLEDGLKEVKSAITMASRAKRKPRSGIPSYCVFVLKAIVTPTRVCFLPAQLETSNRVIREMKNQFNVPEDHFLRVEFRDEKFDQKVFGNRLPSTASLVDRVRSVLDEGIFLGSRRYEYLASSASQLRDHQAWFFCQNDNVTAQSIRDWMGNFSDIKVVAKYNARLGQVFSTTRATEAISRAQKIKVPDVTRNQYCFTDGVGYISRGLAEKVSVRLNLRLSDPTPSAFQIRMGGCKGVLSVNDEHFGDTVCYRASQEKFPSEHSVLEVCQPARKFPAYLNRQLITLLSTLGVPDDVFINLQRSYSTDLSKLLSDAGRAQRVLGNFAGDSNTSASRLVDLVNAGFFQLDDAFLMNSLIAFRAFQMKDLQKRTHVPIVLDMAVVLMGIADETRRHVLQPGEVYASYWDSQMKKKKVLTGRVLIARNPCFHPGDVQFATAVDAPEFEKLTNVIVFSVLGERPLPNMLSGGDLDGDIYWIAPDTRFFPPSTARPMEYTAPTPKIVPHVTIDNVKSFFIDFVKSDNLGVIANAHLVKSDESSLGARDHACLTLAELHSKAVDYCKTGVPAVIPERGILPKSYPTFMEKKDKPSYPSKKVIGLMYDEILTVSEASKADPRLKPRRPDPSRRMLRPGQNLYEDDAQAACRRYYQDIVTQMNHFGVRDEVQLVTGFILKVAKWLKRKRPFEARKQITDSVSSVIQRYRQEFWEEFLGEDTETVAHLTYTELVAGRHLDSTQRSYVAAKAATWYKAGYECDEDFGGGGGGGRQKFMSFGFVVWDVLCEMMRGRM